MTSVTHHRDLRTGLSLWMDRRRPPLVVNPLRRSVKTDVLVIGTGISGAIIAEQLADAGLKVAVVDRRAPVTGSTVASTALLQYEIDTPLSLLSERIGQERAERIWRRSKLAVDALRDRSERLGIFADQVTLPSLYLDGNVLNAEGLKQEAEARRRAGFEVEYLKPAALKARFGIENRHAIVGYGNYSADPRRLAVGFLNAAIAKGARIYSPVDIADIETSSGGVIAFSNCGREIAADAVIFATGYEMLKGIPDAGNKIISSWSIATKPQPRAIWPEAAIIWEAADPYLYIRTTPAGHVICGGEDEDIADAEARDAKLADKAAILSEKLGKLFPKLDATPAYAWAGSFGDNIHGMPTIGPIPRMPNCYAAMGYGGNGITFSMMAGQMLRSLITGIGDPDLDLVSFTRKF
jgi:glycine/D-amino acid oxidase-like deaminating enzyme